ncbi:MAG: hypothetical protein HYX92_22240 [Chloroflexi bacterium]|nr:hypothetical protein [Chloroflexota bacterium]
MERRGIPAAVIAAEKLATTTGKAMARMQGFPDYPIVTIPSDMGVPDEYRGKPEAVERLADSACERVVAVLTCSAAELTPPA